MSAMTCDLCGRPLEADNWFTVTSNDGHEDRVCDIHLELDPVRLVNGRSLESE